MSTPAGTDSIKTVVIGFGLAGRVFHAPFISAVPGLQLTGIVQRSGDEAAALYPGIKTYRSVEDALASNADLLVVATPNETHYDLEAMPRSWQACRRRQAARRHQRPGARTREARG